MLCLVVLVITVNMNYAVFSSIVITVNLSYAMFSSIVITVNMHYAVFSTCGDYHEYELCCIQ